MNTLCQAVDDYLELRRGLGFKLVKYGACLREFVSFLEQKKLPISPLLWRWSSRCSIPSKSQRPKLTDTLPCAVSPATESVSILRPRFLRVVWSEDARGARVRISTLTKKSASCWKPRGSFPRRIACGLGLLLLIRFAG